MEQKREFTGIWIPKEIIEDETLTKSEMIIYAEIACFTECRKSNEALGSRWKLKKNTVSIIISSLIKKGFIESNNKTGEYRKLYANQRGSLIKIKEALSEKSKSLCDKNHTRENRENIKENNITPNPLKGELQGIEIQSFWNKYKSVPNGIRARNITAEKKLLPECRRWTVDLEEIYKKIKNKGYSEEEIKQSIKNYCNDIINRDPKTSYSEHRFSIMEFLKQSNGFLNYINK